MGFFQTSRAQFQRLTAMLKLLAAMLKLRELSVSDLVEMILDARTKRERALFARQLAEGGQVVFKNEIDRMLSDRPTAIGEILAADPHNGLIVVMDREEPESPYSYRTLAEIGLENCDIQVARIVAEHSKLACFVPYGAHPRYRYEPVPPLGVSAFEMTPTVSDALIEHTALHQYPLEDRESYFRNHKPLIWHILRYSESAARKLIDHPAWWNSMPHDHQWLREAVERWPGVARMVCDRPELIQLPGSDGVTLGQIIESHWRTELLSRVERTAFDKLPLLKSEDERELVFHVFGGSLQPDAVLEPDLSRPMEYLHELLNCTQPEVAGTSLPHRVVSAAKNQLLQVFRRYGADKDGSAYLYPDRDGPDVLGLRVELQLESKSNLALALDGTWTRWTDVRNGISDEELDGFVDLATVVIHCVWARNSLLDWARKTGGNRPRHQ